jgi:ubiquinone/menaquinone biosynthesis C-methylase UbiE
MIHLQKPRIIAIDNIKTEIQQAKMHQLPNLTFEKVDALDLEFTDTFDAVISLSCLHWISNKYQVLKNIHRALKPDGKAYLQFCVLHGA